jgi:thioredoxin 1
LARQEAIYICSGIIYTSDFLVADVTSKDFEAEVLRSKTPVVVDFWAAWCGPCRIFSPIIEEVSKEYDGKVKFVKLNTDDNSDIAQKYNIMSIPTAMLFENGEAKAMSVGAVPKTEFKKWLDSNL